MKKIILILVIGCLILPSKTKAQNDGAAAAAVVGGLLAIGSAVASVENFKEQLEHKAVEEILTNHPMTNFKIKTSTLDGASAKDVSSINVVTYEVDNFDNNKKYILFCFLSSGWSNKNGADFNKVRWKLFGRSDWNNLIKVYIETASRKEVSIEDVKICKIDKKGVLINKKYILNFKKIDGDTYLTNDYSDEFKIIFNEGMLGLYLKDMNGTKIEYSNLRGSLVQIREKAIIRAHSFMNYLD
tara:strand:+ start:2169 stop:2894 length:726 start_codon:yes stop_codon:yes gene_type:complete